MKLSFLTITHAGLILKTSNFNIYAYNRIDWYHVETIPQNEACPYDFELI